MEIQIRTSGDNRVFYRGCTNKGAEVTARVLPQQSRKGAEGAPQCFLHLISVCLHLGWQLPLAHSRGGDAPGYGAAPSPVLCPGVCSELCDSNAELHQGRWEWSPADIKFWNIWADLVSCIHVCPCAASPGTGGVVLWGAQQSCPVWGRGCRLLLLQCSQPGARLCSRWKCLVPAGTWPIAPSVGTKRGAASCPSR